MHDDGDLPDFGTSSETSHDGDDPGSAARRLEQLVELVAERVERRVLDDLERRGLRPGTQGF